MLGTAITRGRSALAAAMMINRASINAPLIIPIALKRAPSCEAGKERMPTNNEMWTSFTDLECLDSASSNPEIRYTKINFNNCNFISLFFLISFHSRRIHLVEVTSYD